MSPKNPGLSAKELFLIILISLFLLESSRFKCRNLVGGLFTEVEENVTGSIARSRLSQQCLW